MRLFSGEGDSEGAPVAAVNEDQWAPSPGSSPPESPVISPQHAPLDLPARMELGPGPPLTRKEKQRRAKRDRKRRKRQEEKMDLSDRRHRPSQSEKYPSLKRVRINTFAAESLPSTSNVFVGKTQASSKKIRTLEEMVKEKYTVIRWDAL